jgi:2-phospho-L-lactate/phosphoenolpyruvate guanylyltransferase
VRTGFVALVPVKTADRGKSRIVGISDADRRGLVVAFALDTLTVARRTPGVVEVVVVTDDAGIVDLAAHLGCRTLGDRGDLNGSLRAAARLVGRISPGALAVALCADLPALDAADLHRALDAVMGDGPCFVADEAGTGTTTYVAAPDRFDPHFGPASRAAHLAAGAVEITSDVPTLRRDVDTLDDLEALESLGLLGLHTATARRDVVSRDRH